MEKMKKKICVLKVFCVFSLALPEKEIHFYVFVPNFEWQIGVSAKMVDEKLKTENFDWREVENEKEILLSNSVKIKEKFWVKNLINASKFHDVN